MQLQLYDILEKEKLETIKRSVVADGAGEEKWIGKAQRIFKAVETLVNIIMIDNMSLYICWNPQSTQQQEWTLRSTRDVGNYNTSV